MEWSTGDGSVGWIYLRTAGGRDVLFAMGPAGAQAISSDSAELRLSVHPSYGDGGRSYKKLAAVTVTMGSPRRELILDLAVVGGAAVAVATPVVIAAWTVKRVAGKVFRRSAGTDRRR